MLMRRCHLPTILWLGHLFLDLCSVFGSISHSTVIENGVAPSLVVEPVDTVAYYNHSDGLVSATLGCQALPQNANVSWYKDDLPVQSGMAGIPRVILIDGWLTVSNNKSFTDELLIEGFYYCEASTDVGTVRSKTALIRVGRRESFRRNWGRLNRMNVKETAVVTQTVYMTLPLSHYLLWIVECNGSKINCTVGNCPFWQKLSTVGRLLQQSVLQLRCNKLKKVIPTCKCLSIIRISTYFGHEISVSSPWSYNFRFNKDNKFRIRNRQPEQHISVEKGGNATLYGISGHANSTRTWIRNKTELEVNNNNKLSIISPGVLQIYDVVESDSGHYDCRIRYTFKSLHWTVSLSTFLQVYAIPTVVLMMIEVSSKAETTMCRTVGSSTTKCTLPHSNSAVSLIFLCTTTGLPRPVIQLVKDSELIYRDNSTYSLLRVVKNPLLGIYQCIATNDFGSRQASLYLELKETSITEKPTLMTSLLPTTVMTAPISSDISSSSLIPTKSESILQTELSDTIRFKVATAVVSAVVFILFLVIVALLIYIQRKHQRENSQDAMVMNVAYNVVSDKPKDNAEMEDANYEEVRAS